MKSPFKKPLKIFTSPILKPALFIRDFVKKRPIGYKIARKLSNFVYDHSQETALVMLFGDAVSILSSHNAQIKGLEKSDRENKDILIAQEKIERVLDIFLSIVPPILLTRKIKKLVESGHFTTKKFQTLQKDVLAVGLGLPYENLNNIDHIRPIKETAIVTTYRTLNALGNYKALPKDVNYEALPNLKKMQFQTQKLLRKAGGYFREKVAYLDYTGIGESLQQLCIDFDNKAGKISADVRDKLQNNSAYDEFQTMVNGFTIAGITAYSILSSTVIMPIIRNKLSSRMKTIQLANMGQTRGDVRRRRRFAYTNTQIPEPDGKIFNSFDTPYLLRESVPQKTDKEIPKVPLNTTFNSFNEYNNLITQSTVLRI